MAGCLGGGGRQGRRHKGKEKPFRGHSTRGNPPGGILIQGEPSRGNPPQSFLFSPLLFSLSISIKENVFIMGGMVVLNNVPVLFAIRRAAIPAATL